ncbi:MAG: hypothetical protein ACOCTG_01330 [Bacteroidota bacterium]
MQALYVHISGLIGLLAFLNQLVRFVPLDRTILVGVSTGLVIYVALVFGDLLVKRIIASSEATQEKASGSPSKKEEKRAMEPEAAPAT